MIPAILTDKIQNALGILIQNTKPISGGCINECFLLQTKEKNVFLKYNLSEKFPGMLEAEKHGLGLLQEANALRVPGIILCDEAEGFSFLLEEFIESGTPKKNFWSDFGNKLAKQHRITSNEFGLEKSNYIGSLTQSNNFNQQWKDFFFEERLLPQTRLALRKLLLPEKVFQQLENFRKKFDEIIPEEKPSLLHGDLWNGNYLPDENGSPVVIDPAVYFGHREIDIAMTLLFGGFDKEMYETYHSAFPLQPGWKERIDLHNLYPLLVHVNLFGAGYASQVRDILKRF